MDNPTIEIKGKEYPFLMGRGAIRLYCRKTGVADVGMQNLGEVLESQSTEDNDLLNYFCLKSGSAAEGEKFPYTLEEFQDLLDEYPHLVDMMDRIAVEQTPSPESVEKVKNQGNPKTVKSKS